MTTKEFLLIAVVDRTLLGVILVVASAVSVAVAAWVISWYQRHKLAEEAGEWLPVEARIESGALEGTHESGKVLLPTFAFSYHVSGEYYSGRFSLRPNPVPGKTPIESMIDGMIGRTLPLRYRPDRPEDWFIPDEFIEGHRVEQKIGSPTIHNYYPKD